MNAKPQIIGEKPYHAAWRRVVLHLQDGTKTEPIEYPNASAQGRDVNKRGNVVAVEIVAGA